MGQTCKCKSQGAESYLSVDYGIAPYYYDENGNINSKYDYNDTGKDWSQYCTLWSLQYDKKSIIQDLYGWRSPLPDETCNESLRQEMKNDFEKFANLKTANLANFKSNDIIFLLNNSNGQFRGNTLTKSGLF